MPKMKARDIILSDGRSVEDAIAELKAPAKEKKTQSKKTPAKKEG